MRLALLGGLLLCSCQSVAPTNLGIHDGHLTPCPPTPNCVNSESKVPVQHVEPLQVKQNAAVTLEKLTAVLKSMPRIRIIQSDTHYLRAEATSAVWRFVDDLEFLVKETTNGVEVRSASRLGHSDLGVNKTRIEHIRTEYDKK